MSSRRRRLMRQSSCRGGGGAEFLVRPPTLCSDPGVFCENLVHRLLKRCNALPGIDLLKKSSDKGFVRFDKTEESVGVFLVMTTADPKPKAFVDDGKNPAPVFGERPAGFKSFSPKAVLQELSQSFAPKTRINKLLLTLIRREPVGAKLNVGEHSTIWCAALHL